MLSNMKMYINQLAIAVPLGITGNIPILAWLSSLSLVRRILLASNEIFPHIACRVMQQA